MLPFFRKGFLPKDKKIFADKIHKVIGLIPKNLPLYVLSFTHSSYLASNDKESESNERLEFLGDAILDAVIAEYLFKKFPFQSEGTLTELKSRIVKRDTLNHIAHKIGIDEFINVGNGNKINKSILGNALEALIGAIFLDYGYDKTKVVIENKIIKPFIDVEILMSTTDNFKSLLLEWGDKQQKEISFDIIDVIKQKSFSDFIAEVKVDNKVIGKGKAFSKKRAEQAAAEEACRKLKISVQ